MNISAHLESLSQQLALNKQAFLKNKQNINYNNYPTSISSNQSLQKTKTILEYNLKNVTKTKKNARSSYETVITHLKLIIDQLVTKNQFLIKDKLEVLKENYDLHEETKKIKKENFELKEKLAEIKYNRSNTHGLNGLLDNNNIFGFIEQIDSRIIEERQTYFVQDATERDCNGLLNSQQKKIDENENHNFQSQEQSMLIHQVSKQLFHNARQSSPQEQILSPEPESQYSASLNQLTPNYFYGTSKDEFDLANIQKVKNDHHYVDISSKFISYQNSQNASSGQRKLSSENVSEQKPTYNEVEFSLNTMNDKFYLPIKKNKENIKQQIDTFKKKLHNLNDSKFKSSSIGQSSQNVQNSMDQSPSQSNPNNLQNGIKTFIQCSSSCIEGIFRSFYLSIFQYPALREKFFLMLQELIHDESYTLFNLYPKNEFWVEFLSNFLQFIQTNKVEYVQLINHINEHKLIDILIIQVLKSKVQFLFNQTLRNQELDGSLNVINSTNQIPNLISSNGFITYRDSVNASLQNITQSFDTHQNKEYLEFFFALANEFQLTCKTNGSCIDFYSNDNLDISRQSTEQQQIEPAFRILNNQDKKSFIFTFDVYYEDNKSRITSNRYDNSQQINAYENSVNRPFQAVHLSGSYNSSTNQNNEEQNNNNSQASPVSQTNQYSDEQSNLLNGDYKFNSQNISFQQIEFEDTYRSLNISQNPQQRQILSNTYYPADRCKQLREKKQDYNILYQHYEVIQEQICQTQSKQMFSYNNSRIESKMQTRAQSKSNYKKSKQISQQPSLKNMVRQKVNNVNIKDDITAENYILHRTKSVESDEFQQQYETELSSGPTFTRFLR